MKSKFLIFLIIVCILFIIVGLFGSSFSQVFTGSEDYHSFEELNQLISNSSVIDLNHDYKYDNETLAIDKNETLIINGNDHIIEGLINYDNYFTLTSKGEVIINNLTFKNCKPSISLYELNVTFNNVNFIDCPSISDGEIYAELMNSNVTFNNCTFTSQCNNFSNIYAGGSNLVFKDCTFSGNDLKNDSIIFCDRSELLIINTTFEDLSGKLATAINYKGSSLTILDSKFNNLDSELSAGAVMAKFFPKTDWDYSINKTKLVSHDFLIKNCTFTNLRSTQNGGALFADLDSGSDGYIQKFNVTDSRFINCHSRYGGAIVNVGGVLNIDNSTFKDNSASFSGGAIYTSWSDVNLINSTVSGNIALKKTGGLYFDYGNLTVKNSSFTNNKVQNGSNAIYANDARLDFRNSTFDNGGVSVYAVFSNITKMENINKNKDNFSLNNTDYITSVESNGVKLDLLKNTTKFNKTYPSRYSLKDYGWISPIKIQGDSHDCWAFATANSIESSLLKTTGKSFNLSQNYIQKLQLRYYPVGDARINQTGFAYSGLGNALNWYGALLKDAPYDDRGIVIDTDFSQDRIHVQDAMIIFGGRNDTQDLIKHALMNYGSVSVQIDYATGENAIPHNHYVVSNNPVPNHFVSLIGWDDDYPVDKFPTHPPKPGAWIYKDSLDGNDIEYMSYYDDSFLAMDHYPIVGQNAAIAYIFENDNDYHVNYQTDLTGLTGFDGNYTQYSNEFTSKYDDSIAAVGTYFNESDIDYSFDVYVNGELKHSQDGVSEFAGFKTIVLDKYIPIKQGDKFKVVFKNNALPYQAYSRQHYLENMTFVSPDGDSWSDFTKLNKTVCLKVYTIDG
ncbi:lectin like domain-containing protein [Methanobrevibacter sp.]